ncbi:MAG: hypothetical protein QW521_03615, partial [Desulfurococcaceae archaeon]
ILKFNSVEKDTEFESFNECECTLISTALLNNFTKMLLMKRFKQIKSLATTSPARLLEKIKGYASLNWIEIGNLKSIGAKVFEWETRSGSKVYIIPPLHIVFRTKNGNCYAIEYPLDLLLTST